MVRGEEKQFERIEAEGHSANWSQILDMFTSICGQINTLMRFTRENRSQFIENRVILPYLLSRDRDEELVKQTEGRVQVVDHEMVPDYLRTKPDLEIEEYEKNLNIKADFITPDQAVKQINAWTRLVDHNINLIKSNFARQDNEMARQINKSSYITSETHELLMIINDGKGIMSANIPPHRGTMVMGPVTEPPDSLAAQLAMQKQNVKAPELKTNIKTS